MGSNYWMFVETEENAAITRGLGYEIFGVGPKYRKRANRMQKNDRVIFYTSLTRKWTASATITKKCYEDTGCGVFLPPVTSGPAIKTNHPYYRRYPDARA